MAKKKKSGAKHKSRGDLASAIKGLGVIEKDVAKVRANLRKFIVTAERLVSGNEFLIPQIQDSAQEDFAKVIFHEVACAHLVVAPDRSRAANSAVLDKSALTDFFYLDLNDTARRAALLTAAVRHKIPTIDSLRREYARALTQINGAPLNTVSPPRIVTGGPILRAARARGLVDNSVRAPRYSKESRIVAVKQAEHGLLFLRLQHPPLSNLCDLLVTDILCWPSTRLRGGSGTAALGIAWLVPSRELTSVEIAEFVIHEMVHMNLTLADMTDGLFTRAPGSDFKAHSAVLGRHRPYYHAFHSACVAVAIIYFRLLVGLHSDINWLRSSLRRCTAELMAHRAAFTAYSWNAILAAHAFSRAPRLSAIPVHQDLTGLI